MHPPILSIERNSGETGPQGAGCDEEQDLRGREREHPARHPGFTESLRVQVAGYAEGHEMAAGSGHANEGLRRCGRFDLETFGLYLFPTLYLPDPRPAPRLLIDAVLPPTSQVKRRICSPITNV